MWTRCSSTGSSSRVSASRAENGSSISSTRGSPISDRHSATRCCMPPESSCGSRFSKPPRPTQLQQLAGPLAVLGPAPAEHLHRQQHVVEHGAPGQQRRPLEQHRDVAAGPGDRLARDGDLARRWRGSSPAISRSSVDLPQPDRPTTATNSPSATSRSMPRSASTRAGTAVERPRHTGRVGSSPSVSPESAVRIDKGIRHASSAAHRRRVELSCFRSATRSRLAS